MLLQETGCGHPVCFCSDISLWFGIDKRASILEQYWKLGTASVREILESLPEDERVAYTTVQTLVYRLEEKGALRKVKKIGNAQLF